MTCSRNESCYSRSCSPRGFCNPGTPPFPLWAIILISVTPVVIILIAIKCCITSKKRKLREKLAEYEKLQTWQDPSKFLNKSNSMD